MHVIVADDSPLSRELVMASLEAEGHTVQCAEDGDQAFKLLEAGTAHVLISDWEMPNCDGIELCKRVRKAGFGRYVYIILLTARGGTANLVEGLKAGADDFLSKPFDPAELSVRMGVAARIGALESREPVDDEATSAHVEGGAALEGVEGHGGAPGGAHAVRDQNAWRGGMAESYRIAPDRVSRGRGATSDARQPRPDRVLREASATGRRSRGRRRAVAC